MTEVQVEAFVFFCVFFGAFVFPIWAIIMLVTGSFEKEEHDDEDLRF